MKTIIPKITAILAVVGVCAAISANATIKIDYPMELNSPNIVGIVSGLNGDNPGNDAAVLAQNLLNGVGLGATWTESVIQNNKTVTREYKISTSKDYSGTIVGSGDKTDSPSSVVLDGVSYVQVSGFEYAIAKYDGKNAGWVMFALGGQQAYIPTISHSFWGTDADQYAISSVTGFNYSPPTPPVVPEPTTVLAGLLLLLPFGASAFRIIRKKS